jgi:acyl transferase domain-containing protein/acyl carrier protein
MGKILLSIDALKYQGPEMGKSGKIKEVSNNDIAIIGMHARFPMADGLEEFWENICHGISCVGSLPKDRKKDADRYLHFTGRGRETLHYRTGAYLEDIDKFDYLFFHLSPQEAALMDPLQRLFLETVWNTFEDAGYSEEYISGKYVGVYMGHISDLEGYKYKEMIHEVDPHLLPVSLAGTLSAVIPSRISYLLNLKGPCMMVDTACSSSLVAVDLACQALRKGDCDLAVTGSARLTLLPQDKAYYKVGIESSDGLTRTFDKEADGSGMGEGVAAVLLKPLARALRDGDNIYALIKGSAVNQDGKSMGITAPNPSAQTDVIIQAWENSRVDPASISYVETHGTATKLGDPIEIEGLAGAFKKFTHQKQFCAVSSVKSNLGHLFDCAGIASLIKAILALKHKTIPPTLYFGRPNPIIQFKDSPVYVNVRSTKWETGDSLRRCGVSSFGISGTNCHVVLEEYPAPEWKGSTDEIGNGNDVPQIFTLSAKSRDALHTLIKKYIGFLDRDSKYSFTNLCFTANSGRGHYAYRLAVLAKNPADLREKLEVANMASLEKLNSPWMYFGVRKIVSDSKERLEPGELSEAQAQKLTEDVEKRLREWVQGELREEFLQELCKLYVEGASLPWTLLYKGESVRRISLPVYPFTRSRCWLDISESESVGKEELYYTMKWKLENETDVVSEACKGISIVLGTWSDLVKELRSQGRDIVTVGLGEQYQKLNCNSYIIGPAEDDYQKLMDEMTGRKIGQIIHILTVGSSKRQLDLTALEQSRMKGTDSLFFLTKAILKSRIQGTLEIVLISEYVNRVTEEEERLCPGNAPLFGLGKVVGREYPDITCRAIDIDDSVTCQDILFELGIRRKCYQVSFRKGRKYIEAMEVLDIEQQDKKEVTFKEQGIYMITGGMGKLGLEMAEHLASKGHVKLALVGRTVIPARDAWEAILQRGEDEQVCAKIKRLQMIESTGAEVTWYGADVASLEQMAGIVRELREKYGRINGVIHAAGVPGKGFILQKDKEAFDEVLRPKIEGTWVVDHLTEPDDPDFFVMFSSGVSLIGEVGQGDYTAANSFLDAYAAYRKKADKRTLAINWVVWRGARMAKGQSANIDGVFKEIPVEQAVNAFDKVLDRNITRVLIGEVNRESKHAYEFFGNAMFEVPDSIRFIMDRSKKLFTINQVEKRKKRGEAIRLTGKEKGDYSEIEQKVAQVYREILGFTEMNIYDSFFEIGGDSIQLNRLHAELQHDFPGKVKIVDLFTYTSIEKLANFLTEQEGRALRREVWNKGALNTQEDIAIIGIAARFPGTSGIEEYWEEICHGMESIRQIPEPRKELAERGSGPAANAVDENIKYMEYGYLDGIDEFDYTFFRLSPREANLTDPNQRLFLQTAWHALEDAGYGGKSLSKSKTGIYMGFANVIRDSYHKIMNEIDPSLFSGAIAGNIPAMISTRISYLMDLRGPTITVDTACSSALVATHLACTAIRNGDCDMALAGGIKLFLDPVDRDYAKIGVESSDGRTRTFDEHSDGAGMGEGVGAVVLKPLSRAEADGDTIYALIKGSMVNQDGASIGIMAPNPEAQTEVILQAWEKAGIDPETIAYYEAHGTGTRLGDPLEIQGITDAFSLYTQKKQFCAIGSVKTNIGHLNEGAGIAAMIKAVMLLRNRQIPPSKHFNLPNRKIDFYASPVYINTRLRKWEGNQTPMRCAISAFGISGTNCHMILEEYAFCGEKAMELPPVENSEVMQVFVVSAMNVEALRELIQKYEQWTGARLNGAKLRDVCYTAGAGRGHYNHRLAVLVESMDDFQEKLQVLNTMESFEENGPWFFYGHYKVVEEGRNSKKPWEITIRMKDELTGAAKAVVEKYTFSADIQQTSLYKIGELYAKGAEIDWEKLYAKERVKKISLPGYPFAKTSCWLQRETTEELYYTLEWIKQKGTRREKSQEDDGVILIFMDETRMGETLAQKLLREGKEVIQVTFSDATVPCGAEGEKYRCIRGDEGEYYSLIKEAKDKGISQIIHLSSLRDTFGITGLEDLAQQQKKGVQSLFYLFKAIAGTSLSKELDMVLVSQYVRKVSGEEECILPENAPLFGMGRAIRKEHPNLRCRCIDVDRHTEMTEWMAELDCVNDAFHVAYRKNRRYVGRFTHVDLKNTLDEPLVIRKNGLYLVTGGTGAIGLETAKYIASKNSVRLVLMDRSKMPERSKWDDILHTGTDKRACRKINGIRAIEELGSEVLPYSADVTDMTEMKKALEDIRETYGSFHGIVHGAGITVTEALKNKDGSTFEKVLAPKVQGTWIIDTLTRQDQPDFFVMFSSIATLFDSIYQGDYIAANCYLDAFSEYRSMQTGKTITVNWSTWKEIGMADDRNFSLDTLFKALSPQRALEGFEKVLSKKITGVLIGEMNWDSALIRYVDQYGFQLSPSLKARLEKVKRCIRPEAKSVRSVDEGPVRLKGKNNNAYSDIEKSVAQICREVLGFDEIDIEESFFELGADSVMIKQIYECLEKIYPGEVAVTDIFAFPTVSKLAASITQCREKVDDANRKKQKNIGEKPDMDEELNRIFDEMQKGNISLEQVMSSLSSI